MIEVKTMREAILMVMETHPDLSKYRIAKELNISAASHINNYLTGFTKKARNSVMLAMLEKYDILVEDYKCNPEYRKRIAPAVTEIKVSK